MLVTGTPIRICPALSRCSHLSSLADCILGSSVLVRMEICISLARVSFTLFVSEESNFECSNDHSSCLGCGLFEFGVEGGIQLFGQVPIL